MSHAFTGPGFSTYMPPPASINAGASEFFAKMESPAHSTLRPVTRAKIIRVVGSLSKPSGGGNYTASELVGQISTFNSDMVGGYTANPMNISDLPVDASGAAQWTTDRSHFIATAPFSSAIVGSAFTRPKASYYNIQSTNLGWTLEAIKIASNIPNYIVVRMMFDLNGFYGAVNFRNFTLQGSGTLNFGQALTLDIPIPDIPSEFNDPVPDNIGWAYVPFFGLSWTDFQNRYM